VVGNVPWIIWLDTERLKYILTCQRLPSLGRTDEANYFLPRNDLTWRIRSCILGGSWPVATDPVFGPPSPSPELATAILTLPESIDPPSGLKEPPLGALCIRIPLPAYLSRSFVDHIWSHITSNLTSQWITLRTNCGTYSFFNYVFDNRL